MRSKVAIAITCGVLALGACTGDVKVGDGGADPAAVTEAQARAAAAEAALKTAEMALDELRASLAAAQGALTPGTTAQQRTQARAAVNDARGKLAEAREALPEAELTNAARVALDGVDNALRLTAEALQATGEAAPAGALQLASMHTSLDRAQTALDAAQMQLGEALEANPSATLRNLLTRAQATLTTAQVSLVPLLRADVAARTAERDALTEAHVSPTLFSTTRIPRELGRPIAVTRTARTVPNADGSEWIPNPNALEIATAAVPYAEGVTLLARAGDEEFPVRAITFRGDIRDGSGHRNTNSHRGTGVDDGYYPIIQGSRNTLTNTNPTHVEHTKNDVISSIQFSEDGGLTLKTGGSGIVFNEFQWDIRGTEGDGPDGIPGDSGATTATTATAFHVAMFRAAGETPPVLGATLTRDQADKLTEWAGNNCSGGVSFPCWDGNMRDLTIDFGTPSPDPDGEAGYYWESLIPSSPDQPKPSVGDAMHRWTPEKVANFVNRGGGEYRGEYRLWLSNYGGLDSGPSDAASDDSHRYLQYAAYGLFTFTDYLTSNVRPARMQGFHFGYDAFSGAAGMRTTDLDNPITAKFMGRASAMVMEPHSDRSQVERLIRVRGDLTMNAVIGGANTITGMIDNFEQPAGRAWGPYAPLTDSVRLTNGTINADGSYEGGTTVDAAASHLWDDGAFGGNFYGPVSDLEAAGWWYLTPRGYHNGLTPAATSDNERRDHRGRPDFRYSGVFGSFGAVCVEGCE